MTSRPTSSYVTAVVNMAFSILLLALSIQSVFFVPSVSATSVSHSIPVIAIQKQTNFPVDVGSNMVYQVDPDHNLSLNEIIQNRHKWQAIHKPSPNFGFTADAHWFQFNIQNTLERAQTLYIELPIPFLDDVRLYHFHQKEVIASLQVGDRFTFDQRPIKHPHFILPINLKPGLNEIVMRVAADGTVEVPLTLWTPDTFSASTSKNQFFQGFWLGIVGIMVIYNAFLYLFIRDKNYLYYIFFTGNYLLFQLCLRGFGFAYIWPEQTDWNSYAISTFIASANLGAALMVISYLDLKNNHPSAYKCMAALGAISGIFIVLSFITPYTFTIRVTSALSLVTCVLSLLIGYVSWLKGNKYARFFCLAWTAALVGTSILGAVKFGLVPENYWTSNAGQIGVVILVSLLSIAFANRINLEKELRLQAQSSSLENEQLARKSQEELLKSKESANEELEKKVKERTHALETTLNELELANNRLEILSTTDALTTLYNRGHFERRMNIEFNRADRHGRELSVILCDLDHFKAINDTYGHKSGDECLRHFALTLKNKITRSGDLIARYGGEEFIILLVDTTLENARQLAEALCEETNDARIRSGDYEIQMSASFGVTSFSPESPVENAEQLVHQADIALYEAKRAGRNRVEVWNQSNKHISPIS